MTEEVKKTELYVGDISQYNTIQQYTLLKEHFDGVVVRVGYRGYSAGTIKEDALFAKHMQGLIENRIPYGFYFMGQAVTEQEAVSEAEYQRAGLRQTCMQRSWQSTASGSHATMPLWVITRQIMICGSIPAITVYRALTQGLTGHTATGHLTRTA